MDEPLVEKLTLSLDPILMNRLKTVYRFQKNQVNVEEKPIFEEWILKEIDYIVQHEELRIANQSFYSQRSVPDEDINRQQVVQPKYVTPILYIGPSELDFTDDLAIALGVLEFKKRNEHIYWDCCECYHCDEDEEDYWNRDRCLCHQASCVCWCDQRHLEYHIIYKNDIKYQLITKLPEGKCPGHSVCYLQRPFGDTIDNLRLKRKEHEDV
jgi:hypothetical protein